MGSIAPAGRRFAAIVDPFKLGGGAFRPLSRVHLLYRVSRARHFTLFEQLSLRSTYRKMHRFSKRCAFFVYSHCISIDCLPNRHIGTKLSTPNNLPERRHKNGDPNALETKYILTYTVLLLPCSACVCVFHSISLYTL